MNISTGKDTYVEELPSEDVNTSGGALTNLGDIANLRYGALYESGTDKIARNLSTGRGVEDTGISVG